MGKQIKRRSGRLLADMRSAIRIRPGVFTTGAGLVLAGVGGASVTPAWTVPNVVGNASIILGVILILWGVLIHGLHVWQPWWRGKPFPFAISGWTLGFDYAPGTTVHGIRWEQGFAHSSVSITNESDHALHEVTAILRPEHPIIHSSADCGLATCNIGPLHGSPKVTVVIRNPVAGTEISQPHDAATRGDYTIDPDHRLYCDKLPSGATVDVELATVVPIRGDPRLRGLWEQTRRDPKGVHVRLFWTEKDEKHHAEGLVKLEGKPNDR